MVKSKKSKVVSKKQSEASGSVDQPEDDYPMNVEEENVTTFPYFTYNKKRVFESYIRDPSIGIERGAPFKIRDESRKIVVRPTNHEKRKFLRVSGYEDKLSNVMQFVEYSKKNQGGRYVCNLCRELIRGIVKEFFHHMRLDFDEPLYLQNLDNYLLSGFEPYKQYQRLTNSNLERIRANDEFSTPIKVKLVNSDRSGRKQITELEKLNQLKILIRSMHDDNLDPEFTNFLSLLSVSTWRDAIKHPFLWHWDIKLDCIWYMYQQLYLNGKIFDYAKDIFDDVAFVEADWERELLRDYPPRQVYNTKVNVVRPGVVKDAEGFVGQTTNVGSSAALGVSSLSRKTKRQKRGRKLIKILRNMSWHLTETTWNPVTGVMEYVNIRDGEPSDEPYRDRVHLYRLVKTVFPRFWITLVPILRSKGFNKY